MATLNAVVTVKLADTVLHFSQRVACSSALMRGVMASLGEGVTVRGTWDPEVLALAELLTQTSSTKHENPAPQPQKCPSCCHPKLY